MSVQNHPHLSIILPALNEELRLPRCLQQIDQFLQTQSYAAEVIVVENASTDRTAEITREFSQTHPYVRLIQLAERGKGRAVKAGMLAAEGDYRFICDVDLSMPVEEIVKFLPPYSDGCDISIATREGKGAKRVDEPEYRHIMGRINNLIIKIAALPDFEDTQCGFKMFDRESADDLFSVQQMTGIGYDVELLFVAKRRGYKICEVPITWYFDADSRMRLVQDSLNILREIWEIRQNWRKGVYEKKETASLRFERALTARGYRCIVGIDEAGRGAWAGPVAAGAVCLPLKRRDLAKALEGVTDSKQLSARTRELLIERIKATASGWGVGSAEPGEIDALGIVPATCLAMRRAVAQMIDRFPQTDPDFLLLDWIRWRGLPHLDYQTVVRGDSLSLSIASASVLAKVSRDAWMVAYDAQYPGYGFAAHKGYGVPQHQAALREYGASPLHRMSFAPLRQLPLPFEEVE